MERDGVVSVTLQGSEALGAAEVEELQRLGDRPGEHGVRADLDEGSMLGARGRDGLAEPDRVAHIGDPIVRIKETPCRIGVLDGAEHRDPGARGLSPASAVRSSPRIGSIRAVWEATSMLTLRAKMFCSRAAAMSASTDSAGPATTVWRGEEYTDTVNPGYPAISASVATASSSSRATAPCRRDRPSTATGRRSPAVPPQRSTPGHHGGRDLAHGMPDHRIGFHAIRAPQCGQRQLQTDQHRLHPNRALHRLAAGEHAAQREASSSTKSRSNSATAAAKAGSSANSRRAIPPIANPDRVDEDRPRASRPLRPDHPGGGLPRRERAQTGHGLLAVGRADRSEGRMMGAVVIERVRDIGQRNRSPGTIHPVRDRGGEFAHPLGLLPVSTRVVTAGVGASGGGSGSGACSMTTCALVPPKPNDDTPSAARMPGVRHFVGSATTLRRSSSKVCAVGRIEVLVGRDLTGLHGQCRLDQPDHAGGGLEMAEVGLDGAGQQWSLRRPSTSVDSPQRTGLDRIAEQSPGAVRLHIVHLGRLDAGIGARRPQHGRLRRRVQGHQAVGSTVLIDGRPAHHREHPVPVAHSVGEAL